MQSIELLFKKILEELGIATDISPLSQTPKRVAEVLTDLTRAHREAPPSIKDDLFDYRGNDLITVKNIPFYSLCEHHVLPFFGRVHIGYYPDGKILGISAFTRVVDYFSRKLQTQESLTEEIGRFLEKYLKPKGLGVIISGTHLCAIMRGEGFPDFRLVTSYFSGVLNKEGERRSFLLALKQVIED